LFGRHWNLTKIILGYKNPQELTHVGHICITQFLPVERQRLKKLRRRYTYSIPRVKKTILAPFSLTQYWNIVNHISGVIALETY
jgi:hypothetical protein